jgi:hypothetical protein
MTRATTPLVFACLASAPLALAAPAASTAPAASASASASAPAAPTAPTAPPLSPQNVAAARAAFEQGADLAAEGRWNDALAQFERSAALRPHATTLYNLGFCERALGHATRAKRYFTLALARDVETAGAELTPELRNATSRYLAEVTGKVATPHIEVVPADASVTVDGRPLEATQEGGDRMLAGTRPPGPGERVPRSTFVLELDAGTHEMVVTATDGRSRVVHEEFAPGSTKSVRLEVPPAPPMREVVVDRGPSRRTWGLAIGAVGLVALGGGAYFGLHARSLWNDAKNACPTRTVCPDDEGARLSGSAHTWANLSTVAFAVGGAAVAGGLILWVSAPGPTATAQVGFGPGSITFKAEF